MTGLDPLLRRLPGRNSGRRGRPGDPLNLVFLGDRGHVHAALREAGWARIPVRQWAAVLAGLWDFLNGRIPPGRGSWRFPPMNLYRLLDRHQDSNWAIALSPISRRHHFRLWNTSWAGPCGRALWWGSGNIDIASRFRDLSHVPDPDSDKERDYIMESLRGSPWVESLELVPLPQVPREGANDKGYPFRTDGRALVAVFKAP